MEDTVGRDLFAYSRCLVYACVDVFVEQQARNKLRLCQQSRRRMVAIRRSTIDAEIGVSQILEHHALGIKE